MTGQVRFQASPQNSWLFLWDLQLWEDSEFKKKGQSSSPDVQDASSQVDQPHSLQCLGTRQSPWDYSSSQRIEPWGSWWETPNGLGRREGLSKYKRNCEVFKLFVLAYLSLWTHLRTKFQHQDYSDLKIRWIALPVFSNGFKPLSTILSQVRYWNLSSHQWPGYPNQKQGLLFASLGSFAPQPTHHYLLLFLHLCGCKVLPIWALSSCFGLSPCDG